MQTNGWRPLSEFVRQHAELRPGAPMRVGQPVGPRRREWLFGKMRQSGAIEARGHRNLAAKPEMLPPCEHAGFTLYWQSNRIEHVHSGTVYYGVSVRQRLQAPPVSNVVPSAPDKCSADSGSAPIRPRTPVNQRVPPRHGKFEYTWAKEFDPHISALLIDAALCRSSLKEGESIEGYACRYARAHVRHKADERRKPTRPAVRKHLARIVLELQKASEATLPAT